MEMARVKGSQKLLDWRNTPACGVSDCECECKDKRGKIIMKGVRRSKRVLN